MTCTTDVLGRLGAPRLLVLGDLMLDRYCWGDADRVSPEAPALVLRCAHEDAWPGGAGAVARLAVALGAHVRIIGAVGEDGDGRELLRRLDAAGVERDDVLRLPERPTTSKLRLLARTGRQRPHHLLRVDREAHAALAPEVVARLTERVARRFDECDALLVADHGKGGCAPELVAKAMAAAGQRGVPVLIDPAAGADYSRYWGAELLAPNRAEAALASALPVRSPDEALTAARALAEKTCAEAVLVKLDRDGMVLVTARQEVVCPAQAREVCDVTGAGDMVLAVLGLCRAARVGWGEALRTASVAAALEVQRLGATPISREQLAREIQHSAGAAGKVVTRADVAALAENHRRLGRSVVLTNGCFDLLHAGHAAYLEEAARLGDVLVVAINDDAGVRRLKGEGRPIIGENDRAALVAALGCVGHVLLFAEDTPHEVIRAVRPDVLVKGGDYAVGQVVGREVVAGYGGRVCVTGKRPGLSTTQVREAVLRGALVSVDD